MNRVVIHLLTTLLFCLGLQASAFAQLSETIASRIDNSLANHAFWSLEVRDSTGTVVESLNTEKLVRPASVFKLISSGAFLKKLGSDYRFKTTLYGRGFVEGDHWKGDLMVVGRGDPTINGEFYNGDPLFLFEEWYQLLDSLGVRQIDGNLIAQTGFFDDVPYPKGWEWDDLSYYYAPEISALSFNSNVVDLEVDANGSLGSVPRIQWFPFNTPYVEFINEQVITPSSSRYNESYRRELGSNRIYLRSTLPQGYYETEPLSVPDPALYFIDTFRRYIEQGNIQLSGQMMIDKSYRSRIDESFTELHTHTSEPLHKIVEWLNRESDNFYTEMLLKTMGAEHYQVQGSTRLGLVQLREFMHEMDFDTLSTTLRDGSGMAPATLVKSGDMNRYLYNLRDADFYEPFFKSLSVGGINGTLSYRFRNSKIRENFYGKTGYVAGVRSLSGYLDTATGHRLTVSIFTNNYTASTSHVDLIHQSILEYLYDEY